MQVMAQGIAKVTGTQASAAAALAQLAGSGQVAGENLQQFAQHALVMEKVVGRAVGDTVAMFGELARAPAAASLKFNETMNYLTAATYNRIRALEEMGRKDEAAALAQTTLANAESERAMKLKDNLGLLEKAWDGLTGAAKRAWDSMLGIGRQSTPEAELVKALQNVQNLEAKIAERTGKGLATGTLDAKLIAAQQYVATLREQTTATAAVADADAKRSEKEKANLQLSVALAASESQRTRYTKELAAAKDLLDRAGASPEQRAQLLGQVNDKYREVIARDIDAQVEMIRRGEQLKQEAIKRGVIDSQTTRKLGQISELELIEQTNQAALASLAVKRAAVAEELQAAKGKRDNAKEIRALTGELAVLDEQVLTQKKKGEAELRVALQARVRAIQDVIAAQLEEEQADRNRADAANLDRWNAALTSVNEYARAIGLANEQIALEAALIGQSQQARDVALGQRRVARDLEEQILRIKARGLAMDDEDALIAKARAAAAQSAAGVAAKAQIDEQTRVLESMESTAHAVWNAITQSGQSAFQKIGQMIKSSVLDLLYQMTLKRWVVSIGASVTGAAASAGGAGNGAGGSGLSSLGAGWLTDFGGSTAFQADKVGNWLVSNTSGPLNRFGSTLMENANVIGAAAKMVGDGLGYLNSVMAISQGKWGQGIGSAVGTFFGGPIGGAIGSTVGKWVDNLFGGETRSGASYGVDARGTISRTEGPSGGEIASDQVRQSITTTFDTINATLARLGSSDRIAQFYGGLESSKNGKAFAAAGGTLASGATFGETGRNSVQYVGDMDNQQAVAAFLTDLKRSALQAYKVAAGIPQSFKDALGQVDIEALTDSQAQALLTQIDAVVGLQDALKALPFAYLKNLSFEAANELLKVTGGVQNLGASLSYFYDNFYSEAERTANLTASTKEAFASVGVVMPEISDKTRAWYRAEVERLGAMDLSIEANAKAYTTVLQLAGAVNTLAPAAADAAKAAEQAAAKQKAVADERAGIEREILQAQGNVAELRRLELLALDPANRALKERLWAIQDEQAALAKAQAEHDRYVSALKEASGFLDGVTRNIGEYLDRLNATPDGLGTPQQNLVAAREAWQRQLALAQGGNRDALSGITNYADAFINASKAYSASGGATVGIIAAVKDQLKALPALVRPEQLIVDAVTAAGLATTAALSSLQASLVQQLDLGFTTLDTTVTGSLDLAEFSRGLSGLASDSTIKELFGRIDANGDKLVSRQELTTAAVQAIGATVAQRVVESFDKLDTSVNGLLSPAEFAAGLKGSASDQTLQAIFNKLDVNGDGQLSRLEAIGATAQQQLSTAERQQVELQAIAFQQRQLGDIWTRIGGLLDYASAQLYATQQNGYRADWQSVQLNAIWERMGNVLTVRSNQQFGQPTYFAKGGVFTNQIVSTPTFFNLGAMGEAGPEGIFPLHFGSRGLGVVNYGGGGMNMTEVISALRRVESAVLSMSGDVHLKLVTTDDRLLVDQVMSRLLDRSRNREPVIYATGVVN
jgi:phage-related minor tail protein/Ca2+-binding EF-hand superfamily protein